MGWADLGGKKGRGLPFEKRKRKKGTAEEKEKGRGVRAF